MTSNSKGGSLRPSGSILEESKIRLHSNKRITSQLNLARKKLLPVINEILKTASENASRMPYQAAKSYHLTVEQYKDAIWASDVLKEVDDILKFSKIKKHLYTSFKPQNFNFDLKNIKVNKFGKIYVDTQILVQLIDLHNMLGGIIDYMRDLPAEGQKSISEACKSKISSRHKSQVNSSESMDKKNKSEVEKITKEILTSLTLPLTTNFLVMAANSVQKSKMPALPEERSASEINLTTETNIQVRQSKSTGSVLNSKNKSKVVDAVAARKIIIRCLADLDRVKQYLEQQDPTSNSKTPSTGSLTDEHDKTSPQFEFDDDPCCDCLTDNAEPLNFVWKEDGENGSKLIICIKGKSEDDGDIHVVIRQCPECVQSKKSDGNPIKRFEVSMENLEKPISKISFSNKRLVEDRSRSPSRHNSQVDAINVLFDPDEPSQSIVEGPQIRLFETINLNLQTAEGQDLVISLSVRPKGAQNTCSGFNIDDIFSDSRTNVDRKPRVHVVERLIPLSRTKICSSMEFDVDLVLSKLQVTGVQHPNPKVYERLNDLGVSNILRASRPVKCGRMAVLNEYQKKSLPYSPSLRSLPLDDEDISIINQSLNMSLHKSRHSKIFPDGNTTEIEMNKHKCVHFRKCVYFLQIYQDIQFCDKWEIAKTLIKQKLNFYIYLEDDVKQVENSYEIRYFDVVSNKKNPVRDKVLTNNKNKNMTSPKKRTISTSYHKNLNVIRQNCISNVQKSRIPIYIKNYVSRKKITYKTKSNSNIKNDNGDKTPASYLEHKFTKSKVKTNVIKKNSTSIKVKTDYNEITDVNNDSKEKDNKINEEIPITNIKINNNDKMSNNHAIEIKWNNMENQIAKMISKSDHKIISNSYGDSYSKYKLHKSHRRVNSSGDVSSDRKITSNNEIIVNTFKTTTDFDIKQHFDKDKIKESKQVSLVTIKQVEETVSKDSITSVESKELLKSCFKNNTLNKKLCFKERKKKKEFYTTRSHTQLLIANNLEKKVKLIDFRQCIKEKPQKRLCEKHVDLALSSTRFKRDINVEKTVSQMIVNNFSNFLYEVLIQELSTEAKIEILSKIDEFLGQYCKLQATSHSKCRKNKDVGSNMDVAYLLLKFGWQILELKIHSFGNVFGVGLKFEKNCLFCSLVYLEIKKNCKSFRFL